MRMLFKIWASAWRENKKHLLHDNMNIHLASLTHVLPSRLVLVTKLLVVPGVRGNCSLVHGDHIVIFLFLFESKKVVSNLPAASFKLKNWIPFNFVWHNRKRKQLLSVCERSRRKKVVREGEYMLFYKKKRNFRFCWQTDKTDIFIVDFSNRVIRILEKWLTPYKNSEKWRTCIHSHPPKTCERGSLNTKIAWTSKLSSMEYYTDCLS